MKRLYLLIIVLLLTGVVGAKTYLVTLPYTTFNEALRQPGLADFISNSAVALLNVQTGSIGNLGAAYVTLGAGARGYGLPEAMAIYKREKIINEGKAVDVYRQRIGQMVLTDELIYLDIEALKTINSERNYEINPGFLATILKLKGKSVAYFGNAGNELEHLNPGALAVIDRQGLIYEGENAAILQSAPDRPFGVEANLDKIISLARLSSADIVFLEVGDLDRIEAEMFYQSLETYERNRRWAWQKMAELLQRLKQVLSNNDNIVLFAPFPSKEWKEKGYGLGFIAIANSKEEGSLLRSNTTRKIGLVALTDIAPTLERWSGIDTIFHQGGSVLESVPTNGNKITSLIEEEKRSAILKKLRPQFIKSYILLLIITIGLSFLSIVVFSSKQLTNVLPSLLFTEAAIPFLLLFPGAAPVKYYVVLLFITLLISIVLGRQNNKYFGVLWPILIILGILLLTIDLMVGAKLIPRSIFGYDFQSGARFYGIGNEYMGYLAGLALLGVYFLGFVFHQVKAGVILLALLVVLVAHPLLGANVGGGLTMITAFLAWLKIGARKKLLTPYLLLLPLLVLVWVLFDYYKGNSHLIRTLLEIKGGGSTVFFQVIARKLATNWKLWQYSLWTRGLLAFIGGLMWLVYRPVESLKLYLGQAVGLRKLLLLTLITALAAVVFNDSGVVAGALVVLVPGCFILSSLLKSLKETN